MPVEFGGGEGVDDLNDTVVSNVDRSRRHQLRVQGIKLVRVGIRPESQPLDTTNHGECALKRIDHILSAEAIVLSRRARDGIPRFDDVEGLIFTHMAC